METKLKRNLAVQVIKDHNISEIQIYYSGGGDDGCIDTINYHDHKKKEVHVNMNKEIEAEFDDLLYNLLNENIEWDWINNDGGSGHMYIDCTKDPWNVNIDHSQNVREDHTYSDIDFSTENKQSFF